VNPGVPARRLAFRVEYDGTAYHGWQSQPDGHRTIQGTLADALQAFFGEPISVDGASRTDAGVHALDQLAAATIEHPIRPEGFVKAVNKRLPDDIAIGNAREVPLDYAPRFVNAGKIYRYQIYTGQTRRPLLDRYAWRVPWTLDEEAMMAAAQHLLGTHDFTSFAASDGSHRTAERTLTTVTFHQGAYGVLQIRVEGTAFLKHMVRNLVGTLMEVGRGLRSHSDLPAILAGRSRSLAGVTAPARGLVLEKMLLETELKS